MVKGTRADPFELRAGASDRFYAIFGGVNGYLDPGDQLNLATWEGDGVTLTGEQINGGELQLGGISYPAYTVASVQVSNIREPDLVELIVTVVTRDGRFDKQSLWIKGVKNYAA